MMLKIVQSNTNHVLNILKQKEHDVVQKISHIKNGAIVDIVRLRKMQEKRSTVQEAILRLHRAVPPDIIA